MNEIIALRRRIDDLENKLFYYEDIFENNRYLAIKDKTGLPPTQAVILDVLIRRPVVSHSVFDEIISRRSMRNDRDSFEQETI